MRHGSRFLHDDKVNNFLQTVSNTTESRHKIILPDKALWRAQLGYDKEELRELHQDENTWIEYVPYKVERMKPLRNSAYEGRINPKGIPCLYTANDKETAIAEVRPHMGALVSVAQMKVIRELRLVNCINGHDGICNFYFEEPSPEEREKSVWREIGRAFSEPVSPDPGIAAYVPTQILAELFRQNRYDGVAYKSKLGPGYNIALFDLDILEIVDVRLYPVKAVHYEIGELKKSYVVKHKKIDF